MATFAPQHPPLAEAVDRLRDRSPRPALSPGLGVRPWDAQLNTWLKGTDASELLGLEPKDAGMAAAVRAGLLLWNDDLDGSHTLAQGIETPTGSYWHAVMHRREGDLGNSGYWFDRVGRHPAFVTVLRAAQGLWAEAAPGNTAADDPALATVRARLNEQTSWDPHLHLSWCKAPSPALRAFLEALQVAEIEALLAFCYDRIGR